MPETPADDDDEVVGSGGSEEEAAVGDKKKKKKKKPKKKKSAATTETVAEGEADGASEAPAEAAEVPAAAPAAPEAASAAAAAEAAAAAATVAAVLAAAAAAEGSDEEGEEDGPAVTATGKKKKKNKKKGGATAAVAAAAALAATEEVAAAAVAAVVQEQEDAAPEGGEVVESGEEEEEGAAAAAGGAAKKKKKKQKKKAVTAGKDSETFEKWAAAALERTATATANMTPEELMKQSTTFSGYSFSGSLRPAHVTPQLRMSGDWVVPDYAEHPDGVSMSERQGQREVPILEGAKLQTMREACRLGREVLDVAARFMKAGVTGDQVDRIVFQACLDRKVYPSPLNYYTFPKSVCVSPNEVICHGIPDCRPIEEGDIVNLDITIYHQGFHADLNETFFIGQCDEETHRLVRTAYNALLVASKQIKPGTLYRDLGQYIHSEAAKNACAVVTTYCGHGLGELFHGPPKVPHYRKNKAVGIMKPGHVFTVEPMVNLGTQGGDRKWPDNWTAVTVDGKRSAQFEHSFLVTETGVEVLTRRPGTSSIGMPEYDPAMFQL